MTRLQHLAKLVMTQGDLGERPFVALENIESGTGRLLMNGLISTRSEADAGCAAIEPGDVLFGKLRPYLAKSWLCDQSAYASTELLALRPNETADSRWLSYLMSSRPLIEWSVATSEGTKMPRTSWEKMRSFKLSSVPSVVDQRMIADYLDNEITRVDAIIGKKQQMLQMLVEHEGSLIKESVFSGVELGLSAVNPRHANQLSLPHGWRVAPLNSLCTFKSGKAHEPFEAEDGAFICANSRFISTEGGSIKRCHKNLSPANPSDILMVMSDLPNGRALAKAFFVEDENKYAVNQRVCIIRPHGIDPKYAFYQLNRNPYFLSHDDGSNQTHLSNSCFVHFTMLVPPLEEQKKIVKYLDEMTLRRRSISGAVSKQIVLLSEYRQALITAAVTGELKIPEVAA
jgi:type I restriction enzyme S subunit